MVAPATTPLSYNGLLTQLGVMAVSGSTLAAGIVTLNDAALQTIVPQMLNYAELRIQRDLDIDMALTSLPYTLTAGNNVLALGANDFITVETVQATANGVQYPLTPAAKEYIQNVYNSMASAGAPLYFADIGGDQATGGTTSNLFIIGPWPDANYPVIVFGVQRLPTLNNFGASQTTASTSFTFISTFYPDLLTIACMIYLSAYQRNFGRMSDDPAMAQSYEGQYQILKSAAMEEEDRRRYQGPDWTSQAPSAIATEKR